MNKVVTKLFIKHWRIWLAVTPIFIISGIVFGTAIVLLSALSSADASSGVDYGVFLQVPIVIGGVILCLFTNNAMKQCIDFFDDTNDILLMLGASPIQLSFLMTGQMLLTGIIGASFGILFVVPAARGFLRLLPIGAGSQSLSSLPIALTGNTIGIVLLIQTVLISMTCMRYCLKNYRRRKGIVSTDREEGKKNGGMVIGTLAIIGCIVGTVLLFLKAIPDPSSVADYTNSMKNAMNLLLLLWLLLIVAMNFLIRPLFIKMVKMVAHLPSITKHPLIRSAFYDLQFHQENMIKLIRPVSVIALLIGNFIALFLNTKMLVDGRNDESAIYDLIVSLVFVFGAPILISLANIVTSISLFKMKTQKETDNYFFTGCTPSWIFELKLTEIGTAAILSILITFLGTLLFAIPLLRVAFLGGGDIFRAKWTVNILLTLGIFSLFFLCFAPIYWLEKGKRKAYVNG